MTNSAPGAPVDVAAPSIPSGQPNAPGALLSEAQIRWLRVAVIVMTGLMVAGIAVLIGRIIYLARTSGTQVASAASAAAGSPPALQPRIALALPPGAEVKSMALSGSRLAIEHRQPGAGAGDPTTVTVLDLATGQVVSQVTIGRQP